MIPLDPDEKYHWHGHYVSTTGERISEGLLESYYGWTAKELIADRKRKLKRLDIRHVVLGHEIHELVSNSGCARMHFVFTVQ